MILVNCGASQNLQELLQLQHSDRLIILDSHRCCAACQTAASPPAASCSVTGSASQAGAPAQQGPGQHTLLQRPR